MDNAVKIALIKAQLGIGDNSEDDNLMAYLEAAAAEIIAWRYSYVKGWDDITDPHYVSEVPHEYSMTQVSAVVAGFSIRGAENQTAHTENGISRTFKYEDMIGYIRSHVIPIAGVLNA